MKNLIMFLACGLLTGNIVFAQTPNLKIGYINSATLFNAMPEKTIADSAIAKYAKSFQDEIQLMTKEYQTKLAQAQANEKKMSDAVKEVKVKELQDLQNRIESIQQSAQDKVQQKKSALWEPIIDKVNKSIKTIATQNNYDYIFDATNGAMVYEKEEYDITNKIKANLGIK